MDRQDTERRREYGLCSRESATARQPTPNSEAKTGGLTFLSALGFDWALIHALGAARIGKVRAARSKTQLRAISRLMAA